MRAGENEGFHLNTVWWERLWWVHELVLVLNALFAQRMDHSDLIRVRSVLPASKSKDVTRQPGSANSVVPRCAYHSSVDGRRQDRVTCDVTHEDEFHPSLLALEPRCG